MWAAWESVVTPTGTVHRRLVSLSPPILSHLGRWHPTYLDVGERPYEVLVGGFGTIFPQIPSRGPRLGGWLQPAPCLKLLTPEGQEAQLADLGSPHQLGCAPALSRTLPVPGPRLNAFHEPHSHLGAGSS